MLSNVAHVSFDGDDGLRRLGKISASTTTDRVYWVRLLDYPWPIKLPLTPTPYTTSTGAVQSSWFLRVHLASVFAQGLQRNIDLEAQPWIYDFRITAASHGSPFSWVLEVSVCCLRFVSGGLRVFGLSLGCFFIFRPAEPPPLSAGAGLGNRAALFRHKPCFQSFWAGFEVFLA